MVEKEAKEEMLCEVESETGKAWAGSWSGVTVGWVATTAGGKEGRDLRQSEALR